MKKYLGGYKYAVDSVRTVMGLLEHEFWREGLRDSWSCRLYNEGIPDKCDTLYIPSSLHTVCSTNKKYLSLLEKQIIIESGREHLTKIMIIIDISYVTDFENPNFERINFPNADFFYTQVTNFKLALSQVDNFVFELSSRISSKISSGSVPVSLIDFSEENPSSKIIASFGEASKKRTADKGWAYALNAFMAFMRESQKDALRHPHIRKPYTPRRKSEIFIPEDLLTLPSNEYARRSWLYGSSITISTRFYRKNGFEDLEVMTVIDLGYETDFEHPAHFCITPEDLLLFERIDNLRLCLSQAGRFLAELLLSTDSTAVSIRTCARD